METEFTKTHEAQNAQALAHPEDRNDKISYAKAYYQKNKQHIAAKRKLYRLKNRVALASYAKSYREKHRGEIAQKAKDYRDSNKDLISSYAKAWYQKNRDRVTEKARFYREKQRKRLLAKQTLQGLHKMKKEG